MVKYMNIQIYYTKNNFDVQKAKRFLKERRIAFTEVDLNRHAPGQRELKLFAQAAGGMRALVDPAAKGERAEYVKQLSLDDYIAEELLENPSLLKCPILRNGQKVIFGYDEAALKGWIEGQK